MAAVRQAGSSNVRLTWNGATVLQGWLEQVQAGMEAEAAEVIADLKGSIHVEIGDMRDQAFATVTVAGTKRTLVAGSASDHAIFEELGTSNRPGHPVIRQVMDRHIPHVTQKIAAARRSGR